MGSEEVSFRVYLTVLLKGLKKLLREGVQSADSCIIMAAAECLGWLVLTVIVSQVSPVMAAALFILAVLRGSYWLWRGERCYNGEHQNDN